MTRAAVRDGERAPHRGQLAGEEAHPHQHHPPGRPRREERGLLRAAEPGDDAGPLAPRRAPRRPGPAGPAATPRWPRRGRPSRSPRRARTAATRQSRRGRGHGAHCAGPGACRGWLSGSGCDHRCPARGAVPGRGGAARPRGAGQHPAAGLEPDHRAHPAHHGLLLLQQRPVRDRLRPPRARPLLRRPGQRRSRNHQRRALGVPGAAGAPGARPAPAARAGAGHRRAGRHRGARRARRGRRGRPRPRGHRGPGRRGRPSGRERRGCARGRRVTAHRGGRPGAQGTGGRAALGELRRLRRGLAARRGGRFGEPRRTAHPRRPGGHHRPDPPAVADRPRRPAGHPAGAPDERRDPCPGAARRVHGPALRPDLRRALRPRALRAVLPHRRRLRRRCHPHRPPRRARPADQRGRGDQPRRRDLHRQDRDADQRPARPGAGRACRRRARGAGADPAGLVRPLRAHPQRHHRRARGGHRSARGPRRGR